MIDFRIVCYFLLECFAMGHIPVPQPVFRSVPTAFKLLQNDTIYLPCSVDNLGENVVRWRKGEHLIADSSDSQLILPPRFHMWPNKTLQIDDLEPKDAGEYTCEIIRSHPWSALTQIHAVQVQYPPEVYPIPTEGYLEVKLGEEVQIGCMATGMPIPVVKWQTKGELMQLIDNRHKLKFIADNRLKSGIYQCEASNGIGDPVYANIRLRILYKPEITVDRSWVHSSPGVRAELVCRVVADPEAEIHWYFERSLMEFSSSRTVTYVHGDGHILLFRTVRETDFGEYACKASNKMGDAEETIVLSGAANPAIFKRDNGRPSSTSYTLIWEVDSYSPIIEYNLLFRESKPGAEWIRNLTIPADPNSPGPLHSKSYTLTGLQKATVYEAIVLSRNRYGWSNPSSIIKFGTEGAELQEEEIQETQEESSEKEAVQRNLIGTSKGSSQKPQYFLMLISSVITLVKILNFRF